MIHLRDNPSFEILDPQMLRHEWIKSNGRHFILQAIPEITQTKDCESSDSILFWKYMFIWFLIRGKDSFWLIFWFSYSWKQRWFPIFHSWIVCHLLSMRHSRHITQLWKMFVTWSKSKGRHSNPFQSLPQFHSTNQIGILSRFPFTSQRAGSRRH
jgi:hypothetical protein